MSVEFQAAGMDGCRGGWLAIARVGERDCRHWLLEEGAQLLELFGRTGLTFVDIPIGLAEGEASRRCDRLLRKTLGGRFSSSVFNPPIRAAVYAESYGEACDRNFERTGKKISKQSWQITRKIRQVDEVLLARPDLCQRVLESHPELLFFKLNGDRPLRAKKKTLEGQEERLGLLARVLPQARDWFAQVRKSYLKRQMADDDIVDALGLALAAEQGAIAGVKSLPELPEYDDRGMPMAIHCPHRCRARSRWASPKSR
ncbi:DUF429 domain-containing protein [Synechococcus sp. PCC 7336]|uniref:DUF429 domain-containing protein n=1 Tax=Synechococcus sp. PCC 7336 TaxID=195250 RepID=UPI00034941AB|nr:DUF429 domain-containing protein [Synechococcus sp. PCC 7336]